MANAETFPPLITGPLSLMPTAWPGTATRKMALTTLIRAICQTFVRFDRSFMMELPFVRRRRRYAEGWAHARRVEKGDRAARHRLAAIADFTSGKTNASTRSTSVTM